MKLSKPLSNEETVIEQCAKELERMMRGRAAHEILVLTDAVWRLREKAPLIIMRSKEFRQV
jgi:hypothetical protein